MAEFAPTVPRVEGNVFLIMAMDAAGSAAPRDENLEGHLEHIEKHYDQYLLAGPLREPNGTELIGSFFLVVADDEAAARELLDGDPYFTCGMYADIRVLAATPAAGRSLGGVIWESAEAVRAVTS